MTYIVFHQKVYETEYTKVSQRLPLSKRSVFNGETSEISINAVFNSSLNVLSLILLITLQISCSFSLKDSSK